MIPDLHCYLQIITRRSIAAAPLCRLSLLRTSAFCLFLASNGLAQAQTLPPLPTGDSAETGQEKSEVKEHLQQINATISAVKTGGAQSEAAAVINESKRRLEEAKTELKDSPVKKMVEEKVREALAARRSTETAGTPTPVGSPTIGPTLDPRQLMSIDPNTFAAYDFSRFTKAYFAPLKKLVGLPPGIIKHLRGKEGGNVQRLLTRDELINLDNSLPPNSGPSTRMRGFLRLEDAPGVRFPLITPPPKPTLDTYDLPDCSMDQVREMANGFVGKNAKDLLSDTLYLKESHKSQMPENGFGKSVELHVFSHGRATFEVYRAIDYGLRCLPWRTPRRRGYGRAGSQPDPHRRWPRG